MFLKILMTSTSVVSMVLGLHIASAQPIVSPYGNRDMENIDIENAYKTPLVYVLSVTDVVVEDEQIRGNSEVMNADDLGVGDIGYRVEIVGTEVDAFGESQSTFWRGERMEIGALAPQEKRAFAFSVPVPSLPQGSYLVRIQILTSQGRHYGWGDAPLSLKGDTGVTLDSTGIVITQYGTAPLDPLSGPNIDPDTSLTITAAVTNIQRDMTVVPVLSMFDFDTIRHAEGDIRFDPVLLKKGQEKTLSYIIKSRKAPGVTLASLILTDSKTGNQLSPLADFRWVIRGQTAHVMALRPQHLGKKEGDILAFRVDLVGSPDAESVVSGTLSLSIQDDAGTAAELEKPFSDLKDGILSGDATLPLKRNLGANPRIESVIRKSDGTMLHTYSVPLAFSDEGKANLEKTSILPRSWAPWVNATSLLWAIGSILAIIAIIVVLRTRKG